MTRGQNVVVTEGLPTKLETAVTRLVKELRDAVRFGERHRSSHWIRVTTALTRVEEEAKDAVLGDR